MRQESDIPPAVRDTVALGHVPALDGLRGAAVAAVVLYHLGYPWARGGFLGVSAFFTLSGFLIGSLLLDEHAATGRVDLRRFWARRARRLLPAAVTTLLAVVAVSAAIGTPAQLRTMRGDVVAALANVANWRFLHRGADYAALWEAPSPLQHFWSLAVEEQFYVAFPALVCATFAVAHRCRRSAHSALVGVLVVALAASTAAGVLHANGEPMRSYYGTDARAAEILAGVVLAVVAFARRQHRPDRHGPGHPRLWTAAGMVVAVGLIAAWVSVDQHAPVLHRGGFLVHAAATAALIASLLRPGPLTQALAWPPLRALGKVSYAVYLFHWPVLLWLTPARTAIDGAALDALRLSVTIGAAALSHVALESPIRTGRRLGPTRAPLAAVAGAASVVVAVSLVAGLAAVPTPVLASTGGLLAPTSEAPPRPTATQAVPASAEQQAAVPAAAALSSPAAVPASAPAPAAGERVRIYIGGDSVSYLFGLALRRWAEGRGDVEVWVSGQFACHVVRGGTYRYAGVPKATEHECNSWEEGRVAQVREARPHVALLVFGAFDVLDRRLPGSDEWEHVGQPRYDEVARREIAAMTDLLRAQGTRLAWATYPAFRTGVTDGVAPSSAFPESDPARITRWNQLLREAVGARPDARLLDLRGQMQRLPGGEGDARWQPDGLHPVDEAADLIASWLGPQLLAIAGGHEPGLPDGGAGAAAPESPAAPAVSRVRYLMPL